MKNTNKIIGLISVFMLIGCDGVVGFNIVPNGDFDSGIHNFSFTAGTESFLITSPVEEVYSGTTLKFWGHYGGESWYYTTITGFNPINNLACTHGTITNCSLNDNHLTGFSFAGLRANIYPYPSCYLKTYNITHGLISTHKTTINTSWVLYNDSLSDYEQSITFYFDFYCEYWYDGTTNQGHKVWLDNVNVNVESGLYLNCSCSNCSDCINKLNSNCSTVTLINNISNANYICIDNPVNFTGKTFNCGNNIINGDNDSGGAGIYLLNNSGNIIQNCVINNFTYGINVENSVDNIIGSNTITITTSGITLTNSTINIFNNNIITNNSYGYDISADSTGNSILSNVICNNTVNDVNDLDSTYGINNYCDNTLNFHDTTFSKCTYFCNGSLGVNYSVPENSTCLCYDLPSCIIFMSNPNCTSINISNDLIANGTCFNETIIHDNTTINCNYYTITGNGTGYGAYLLNKNGVNINYCTFNNFEIGLGLDGVINSNFYYNTLNNNDFAFVLLSSLNNNIKYNDLDNNDYGFSITDSDSNNITNNIIDNSMEGIYSYYSFYNNYYYNKISHSSNNGIYSLYSDSNVIAYNNITLGDYGLNLIDDDYNNIQYNNINYNNFDGIEIQETDNSYIKNNNIKNNDYGIEIFNSTNNEIENNNISYNNFNGIDNDVDSTGNTLNNNYVCFQNPNYDIYDADAMTGDNNTCDLTSGYNDNGISGCTNLCSALPVNNTCDCSSCSDCNTKISLANCTTIILTVNINNYGFGTCINNTIYFDNKIFDCDNHIIDGIDGSNEYGFFLSGNSNNIIKNCVITDYDSGIHIDNILSSSNYNKIINNNFSSNSQGIYTIQSDYTNISGNSFSLNNYGIYVMTSDYNYITNNELKNNWYSIYTNYVSESDINYNNINLTTNYGLVMILSDTNEIIGNNIENNLVGAVLNDSNNNDFNYNNVKNNDYEGIYLINSWSNDFYYNNITNNLNISNLVLDYSNQNNIISNNLSEINGTGLILYKSDENIIMNNNVYNCYVNGILLINSTSNKITYNNLNYNENGLITVWSYLNNISYNNIHFNNQNGIEFIYSNITKINNNNVCDNNVLNGSFYDINNVHLDYTGYYYFYNSSMPYPEFTPLINPFLWYLYRMGRTYNDFCTGSYPDYVKDVLMFKAFRMDILSNLSLTYFCDPTFKNVFVNVTSYTVNTNYYAIDNTCDSAYEFNDAGNINCTYTCDYVAPVSTGDWGSIMLLLLFVLLMFVIFFAVFKKTTGDDEIVKGKDKDNDGGTVVVNNYYNEESD